MAKRKSPYRLTMDFIFAMLFVMLGSWFFCLTWNRVAPTYFYWLPKVYQNIPFWDAFCLLFAVRSITGCLFLRVTNSEDQHT